MCRLYCVVSTPSFVFVYRGTPRGSFLSPFLFNVAMKNLPQHQEKIPHVCHAIYADDITIWTTWGKDGEQHDALQAAADAVIEYAEECSLECSPGNSDLLVLKKKSIRKSTGGEAIEIHLNQKPIPRVETLRILGVHVQDNGHHNHTINALRQTAYSIARMISRVFQSQTRHERRRPTTLDSGPYHQ